MGKLHSESGKSPRKLKNGVHFFSQQMNIHIEARIQATLLTVDLTSTSSKCWTDHQKSHATLRTHHNAKPKDQDTSFIFSSNKKEMDKPTDKFFHYEPHQCSESICPLRIAQQHSNLQCEMKYEINIPSTVALRQKTNVRLQLSITRE